MESTLKPPTTSTTSKKYPATSPPNDSWTIEQLLFWSLDQYHSAAISKTNSHLSALRLQCENECDDVLMLHELAVQMTSSNKDDDDDIIDDGPPITTCGENENVDPQQNDDNNNLQQHKQQQQFKLNQKQPAAAASSTATTAAIQQTTTSSRSSSSSSNSLIITILSGPHASQTYKLQPKHTQPCLIGRSKGKKFLRNGISLNKDQEVSTTHGKFSVEVEEQEQQELVLDHHHHRHNPDTDTHQQKRKHKVFKFYYTDVGSTNGSTVGEARLEANVRVEIEEGMELRIGNSTLKIAFG